MSAKGGSLGSASRSPADKLCEPSNEGVGEQGHFRDRLTCAVRRPTAIRPAAEVFARRVRWLTLAFAVLLLLDFGLFGWLLFRSLSQRELERVLLETRESAEAAAESIGERLPEGESLEGFETRTDFVTELSALARRKDIESVLVRTTDGILVYSLGGDVDLEGSEHRDISDLQVVLPQSELEVPIRGIGTLVVGLSPEHLRQRVTELRSHLLRLAGLVAALTAALLLTAYGVVTWLYRRSRALERQAEEAEQLAYLGTLASGLAHEIRNPLNAVSLNLQMLEEGAGESRERLFDITRSEVQRLERLVTDFLAYARPRRAEPKWESVGDLLAQSRDLAAGTFAEAGVELQVEGEQDPTEIYVDEEQIKQVILNLLHNALAVSLDGEGGAVRLWARRTDGGVTLGVSDRGPGIPEEDRDKVFRVFYSNRRGGTGLGLAIVRRFAEAHQAEARIDDGSVGWGDGSGTGGTTVSLTLPREAVR